MNGLLEALKKIRDAADEFATCPYCRKHALNETCEPWCASVIAAEAIRAWQEGPGLAGDADYIARLCRQFPTVSVATIHRIAASTDRHLRGSP